jgi:hypothetical protein
VGVADCSNEVHYLLNHLAFLTVLVVQSLSHQNLAPFLYGLSEPTEGILALHLNQRCYLHDGKAIIIIAQEKLRFQLLTLKNCSELHL